MTLIISRRGLGHGWRWRLVEGDGQVAARSEDHFIHRREALLDAQKRHEGVEVRVLLDPDPYTDEAPLVEPRPEPVVQTPEDVIEPEAEPEEEDAEATA